MLRVLLLADVNSPHTIKWAIGLSKNGLEVGIFTLSDSCIDLYKKYKKITLFCGTINSKIIENNGNGWSKIKYLLYLNMLRSVIKKFNPDIIHAHYATSYGLLGALSGFHPFIISVWGSDIFEFPNKSYFHKQILEFNLKKADCILSTSKAMAKETTLYTDKDIIVTPFGVDLNVFKAVDVDSFFNKDEIVIGTVKTLEEKYGIEYLIEAFAIVSHKYKDKNLKLLIVGGGSQEYYLKDLASTLDIEKNTIFTGKIPYVDVVMYHNMLSVFVSVSNSESFGVAVIEASACGKPVVVSDVGGLPEVVENGVTGFVVPAKNVKEIASAIEKLILDDEMRCTMGLNGRKRVKKLFEWNNNVKQMICIYKETINS